MNGLLSIVNHSNSEIQQNRNRLNFITNVTRGVIRQINSVTSVTNRLSTSMKAIKVNLMFENTINSLENCVAEIDNQRQLYERQKIQLEAKRFTQELLSGEELYRILKVHNGGNIAIIQPLNWYYMYCVAEPIWTGNDLVYRDILPLVYKDAVVKYELQTFPVLHNVSRITTLVNMQPQVAIDKTTGWVLKLYDCVGTKPEVCKSNIAVPSHNNCELAIIMGKRSGYEHCTVTIATDAVYDKIQERIEGQYVIMSSGATVDVRCQGDIPRRIDLKEGVHLLHVQPTCMYSTQMWMLKPIKHVRGKAISKFTHIDAPRVNVREVLQGHIKNYELSLDNVEDLATVKTVELKPLAPESVLFNDKIFANDRNMYDIIMIILLGIVYA